MSEERETLTPPIADCREELSSIAESRTFEKSPKLVRLLQYLCANAAFAESGRMNEHTIAVDLFGKPADFKENKDSTVRVEMHRLRTKLSAFYADEGAEHRIRIVVSTGNYTPVFQFWPGGGGAGEALPEAAPPDCPAEVGNIRRTVLNGDHAGGSGQPDIGPSTTARRRPLFAVAVTFAILCLAAAAVALYGGRSRPAAPPAPMAMTPNQEVHILAGYSGGSWVDAAGRRWQSDRYYQGGVALPGPGELTPSPPERRLFQTMRQARRAGNLPDEDGMFAYDIPMKAGTYELRLYFADPIRQSPQLQDKQDAQNLRHFDVAVNGQHVLKRIDVVADSGSSAVDVRAFRDIQPAPDGRVHLEFTPNPNQPFLNALELVPSRAGHTNPIRITPRQSAFTDSEGTEWGPDDYFLGGRLIVHRIPAEARLPELYRAERYGNFTYAIPVPPGVYSLTLYFAEAMFAPSAASVICRGPGCRVFDVACNGAVLLHDFDVFETAGGAYRPITRTFHGLRPNGQGKLLVSFSPSIDYAEVRAIEVLDETP